MRPWLRVAWSLLATLSLVAGCALSPGIDPPSADSGGPPLGAGATTGAGAAGGLGAGTGGSNAGAGATTGDPDCSMGLGGVSDISCSQAFGGLGGATNAEDE